MNPVSINERVRRIKNNKDEINRFVEEYKPFIASCTEKQTGRYVKFGEDDELSIAMMAFVEAINSHNVMRGNFLSFAKDVIKKRLIDYYRKEKKHRSTVPMSEYCREDDEEERDICSDESMERYKRNELSEYRRLELMELGQELDKWDITFISLTESSPKHAKTKKLYAEILGYLLSRPELLIQIKHKKSLPAAEIEMNLHIPRKTIERARKYIIAAILINTGDYQYIRSFVDWG